MSTSPRPSVTPQAVVGVSICLAGIALTLDNLGLFELRSIVELWPVVPISIGVLTLMYGESRQDWVKGTLWLVLGLFFIFRHPLMHDVWPLALVALGGYLVWRARTGPPPARKWETDVPWERDDPPADPASARPQGPVPGPAPFPPGFPPYGPAGQSTSGHGTASSIPRMGTPEPASSSSSAAAPPASGQPASGQPASASSFASHGHVPPLAPPPIPPIPPPIPPGRKAQRGGFGRGCSFGSRTAPPPPPGFTGGPQRDEYSVAGFATGPERGKGQRASLFALLSGIRRQVTGAFAGAEATAIMGGIELDLRYSAMDGEEVVIDTFALWGGIEIWVPPNWQVVSQGLPLMGGFEDKTHITVHGRQPRLVVRGVAIMGGVEIKN